MDAPQPKCKRGRPLGIKPSAADVVVLEKVWMWLTWPQWQRWSFDRLVRFALGYEPPEADVRVQFRTARMNRLQYLHQRLLRDPVFRAELGFFNPRLLKPRLPPRPKRRESGAAYRWRKRAMAAELEELQGEARAILADLQRNAELNLEEPQLEGGAQITEKFDDN
jgi:hypothetical protein